MIEMRGPVRRGWWVGLRGSSSNSYASLGISPGGSPAGEWVMSITSSMSSVLVVRNGVGGFAGMPITSSVGVGGVDSNGVTVFGGGRRLEAVGSAGDDGGNVCTGYVSTWR